MRKMILLSLAAVTVAGSLATPTLAQQASRGQSSSGSGGRGEYQGIEHKPVTHVRAKRYQLIQAKGGAYCSTNWLVLFDENGRRTRVRHCDDRNHIDID
ncbi:hypothetical protein [Shinella sp. BYT-45]|uniref:hypothetical protein n=1 Tax=Shinella sp. BYT-45 TaxID=3377377 RepID=UPI00397FAA47